MNLALTGAAAKAVMASSPPLTEARSSMRSRAAPELQAKLLRVLQERSYRRVGGNEDKATDVRIIACTNRDLSSSLKRGASVKTSTTDSTYRPRLSFESARHRTDRAAPLRRARG